MNAQEYLSKVAHIARTAFAPNDMTGSMTVAKLGSYVRQVTGLDPISCGFAKFKDALNELARQGHIKVGLNSKDALAYWLASASRSTAPTAPPAESDTPTTTPPQVNLARSGVAPYKRLRNTVWLAFVGVMPDGRRFMHRETGELRVGRATPPEPAEQWCEIEPIDPAADKADAAAFLKEIGRSDDEVLCASLDSPNWFHQFALALSQIDAFLAVSWKRRRTGRVVAHVEQWRQQQQIAPECVYQGKQAIAPAAREGDEIRRAVFAAINELSTDELLSLRLPLRQFLSVLRPDLVKK